MEISKESLNEILIQAKELIIPPVEVNPCKHEKVYVKDGFMMSTYWCADCGAFLGDDY